MRKRCHKIWVSLNVHLISFRFPVYLRPSVEQQRGEVDPRPACKNILKNIGLGLHNYHAAYGCLPPAYVTDENGRPMHSWRVLLLPYVDQAPLYEKYDFSVPWDHPNNRRILDEMPMPEVYYCPDDSRKRKTDTSYFACFGPSCAFRGEVPVRFSDISDGLDVTLLVGEATGLRVPWTKPHDIDVSNLSAIGELSGFSSTHVGDGAHFVFGDGAVRYIRNDIDPEVLRNFFTINDGNKIPDF